MAIGAKNDSGKDLDESSDTLSGQSFGGIVVYVRKARSSRKS